MHTDPIADLLTRIRNGKSANHSSITVPHSNVKSEILRVMKENGFIDDFKDFDHKGHKEIQVFFKEGKDILSMKRVSRPGRRIYVNNESLKPLKNGLGIRIISTSKGIMTNTEAKKAKVGGELICEIY